MRQLERQLKSHRESLEHVDASLRLLDPTLAVESIPNKRLRRHINLFRQSETRPLDARRLEPSIRISVTLRNPGVTLALVGALAP
jgi:hypothetical protein